MKKKTPPPPTPKTEIRLAYGGYYVVSVDEHFYSHEAALAFAKKLGLPTFETTDTFD